MAYGSGWVAASLDAWGEAPRVRLLVRLYDGVDGAPGTLVTFNTDHETISLNPILREVERTFGVIQSQSWQLVCMKHEGVPSGEALDGCWASIQIGYEDADEWETFGTGQIVAATFVSDDSIEFEINDTLVNLVEAQLKRDLGIYSDRPYCGPVRPLRLADGSQDYNNDIDGDGIEGSGVSVISPSYYEHIENDTFTIEFTSQTAFKVILSNGDQSQTGTIAANCDIKPTDESTAMLRLDRRGWSTDVGAYSIGDQFVFDTSVQWDAGAVTYVVAQSLIAQHMGPVLDVVNNDWENIFADLGDWDDAASAYPGHLVSAEFRVGDSVMDIVQQLLELESASLWVNAFGKYVLRRHLPDAVTVHSFNSDESRGDVDLIETRKKESAVDAYNVVEVRYRDYENGAERTWIERDANSPYLAERKLTIETSFAMPAALASFAASRALARFKRARSMYILRTTFTGAAVLPSQRIEIVDPSLGERGFAVVDVVSVEVDPFADEAQVTALNEPLNDQGYARVGDATTIPVGVRVGGPSDPGTAPIW